MVNTINDAYWVMLGREQTPSKRRDLQTGQGIPGGEREENNRFVGTLG